MDTLMMTEERKMAWHMVLIGHPEPNRESGGRKEPVERKQGNPTSHHQAHSRAKSWGQTENWEDSNLPLFP